MHLSLPLKRALLIGGIGLAAVIVGVAITQTRRASQPSGIASPDPTAPMASIPQPASTIPIEREAASTPVVYAASPFGTPAAPVVQPPVPQAPLSYAAVQTVPSAYPERRVVRSRYTRTASRAYRSQPRARVVVKRRPFGHSAAIVGGSAAGGAAIGALAGGGKGAIAGGLVGGAGGLVYDRLTHKKRRVVVTRE